MFPLSIRLDSHMISGSQAPRLRSISRDNGDDEIAWFLCTGTPCGWFRRRQVDVVGRGIHAHGSGALWRLDRLDYCESSRRGFADHGQRPVGATGKNLAAVDFDRIDVI